MSMPFIKASHTRRRQAITDIIESVALEEAGLAHILNAEGEELQKILCFHDLKVEDIVCVNASVVEVVKAIADLEHELHEKLELFEDCLCGRFEHDDDDDRCDENGD